MRVRKNYSVFATTTLLSVKSLAVNHRKNFNGNFLILPPGTV